jgi:hypothetical protein
MILRRSLDWPHRAFLKSAGPLGRGSSLGWHDRSPGKRADNRRDDRWGGTASKSRPQRRR